MNRFVVMRNRIISLALALPFALMLPAGCGPGTGTDPATEEQPCSLFGTCDGDLTCCDGVCVDIEAHPDHCGACGVDCSADGGFCSSDGSCAALRLRSLCENANLLALYDGNPPDDGTTDILRDAVADHCNVSAESGSTTDRALVDDDGVPLVGVGTTIVMGGGGFFQPVIRHVENEGVTPIYTDQVDAGATSRMVRRSDGAVLATVPSSTSGEDEDWFTVYLVEEPTRGALVLAAYGFTLNGTRAAGVWARDAVLGDLDDGSETWWAVRWADTDGTSGPSEGDTFEVVDSGD